MARWLTAGGLIAALTLVVAPTAASACRFIVTPPKIDGDFTAIVLAEVDVARDIGQTGSWTWEIEARVDQVIDGQPGFDAYGFRYNSGSNGCSSSPPSGLFVLFISTTPQGERVTEALPLWKARDVDPRVHTATVGRDER